MSSFQLDFNGYVENVNNTGETFVIGFLINLIKVLNLKVLYM